MGSVTTQHGSEHENPKLAILQGCNDAPPTQVRLVWREIKIHVQLPNGSIASTQPITATIQRNRQDRPAVPRLSVLQGQRLCEMFQPCAHGQANLMIKGPQPPEC
eukprot:9660382-Heterocapsa_arctica.AAC.1